MKKQLVTRDQWREYLQEGQRNSIEAILDYGKRIYEFKQSCPGKQGGSTFAQDVKEWLGMSNQSANHWVKIGENNKTLLYYNKVLPPSRGSIYQLTTLTDEQFQNGLDEGVINPEATQADILAYKRRLGREELQARVDEEAEEQPEEQETSDEEWEEYFKNRDIPEPPAVVHDIRWAATILGIDGCIRIRKDTLKIIYRGLSNMHHPDKGGDSRKQQELNKARNLMEQYSYE